MKDSIVGGRFVREDGTPVSGQVRFIPSKLWIEEDGRAYATLAPCADLVDGRFSVALTRTDTCVYDWFYTVESPVGSYTIWIEHEGPMNLKDLLPKHLT